MGCIFWQRAELYLYTQVYVPVSWCLHIYKTYLSCAFPLGEKHRINTIFQ